MLHRTLIYNSNPLSSNTVSLLIKLSTMALALAAEGKPLAIGIDLGTTYSCVGVWRNDHVQIIPNEQGNRTTPSYVAFTDTRRLIGDAAKNQASMNPINTVFGEFLRWF